MGLFKSIGRAIQKVAKATTPKALRKYDPIGKSLGLYGKEKKGPDLAAQQSAATAAQSAKIDSERAKIAQERSAIQANMNRRNAGASRRRVRGGLFGDTTVDQNVQARLG